MTDTTVFVMRHGQSEGNVARIWTSARAGYPLTDLGREQARAAAVPLLSRNVSTVYGSPLVRAQQTAEEVAGVLGLSPLVLEGVEELHVGVHEGQHDDDVAPIAMEVFGRWLGEGDFDHGFEGGETGREIAERMSAALNEVADAHPGEAVVVVSHGGSMAVGLGGLCDNLPVTFVGRHLLANTDVVEARRSGGEWHCVSWAGLDPVDGADGDR
ncbi:MAG: histidine phosphatase family protein [Actinobacteria bacterium]|nr:histidine phosphatase family protein [Actinomycetota bacterium]